MAIFSKPPVSLAVLAGPAGQWHLVSRLPRPASSGGLKRRRAGGTRCPFRRYDRLHHRCCVRAAARLLRPTGNGQKGRRCPSRQAAHTPLSEPSGRWASDCAARWATPASRNSLCSHDRAPAPTCSSPCSTRIRESSRRGRSLPGWTDAAVLDFLDLRHFPLHTALRKQNPGRLVDLIKHYHDLQAALSGTAWEVFLHEGAEPAPSCVRPP